MRHQIWYSCMVFESSLQCDISSEYHSYGICSVCEKYLEKRFGRSCCLDVHWISMAVIQYDGFLKVCVSLKVRLKKAQLSSVALELDKLNYMNIYPRYCTQIAVIQFHTNSCCIVLIILRILLIFIIVLVTCTTRNISECHDSYYFLTNDNIHKQLSYHT